MQHGNTILCTDRNYNELLLEFEEVIQVERMYAYTLRVHTHAA